MAIDFQQVYQKIREIGANAQQRKKTLDDRRELARHLLQLHADNLEGLRWKLETVKETDPAIRCAAPFKERLDAHYPAPDPPSNAVLIAADGSQINPNRHAALQFGLINVGAIVLRLNSGAAPQLVTDSQLLFDDELYTASGNPLTESLVALQRDLQERSKLYDLAAGLESDSAPVITFTDGPIELWGSASGEDASAYEASLTRYLAVLSRLQTRGIVTAGYVDKPGSDLLIRLLELATASDEDLKKLREYHPLRGVTDRWLFGDKTNPLLQPGERSAVFKLQAKNEKRYNGVLSLHFFYLNVGTERHPWPVRVEIPKWVADDPEKLGMLHAILIQQCRIMGAKPYPYLLHRAHETAVVTFEEQNQIAQLLGLELRRAGVETDDGSHKQSAKELPGKTRF